jgi:UPF0716 family protein affecting phage T7 exclusion
VNIGAIIGVLATLVVGLLAAMGVFFFIRRRGRRNVSEDVEGSKNKKGDEAGQFKRVVVTNGELKAFFFFFYQISLRTER